MIALLLTITGRVQGVGYRDWLLKRAQAMGIEGWVRNRANGTVEALLHGEEMAIFSLSNECKRGPSHARVENVSSVPAEVPTERGFRRLPTA